ncbi:hypothetical protein Sango_2344400 [Sesamum angolense]|uniref:Myb/SANT-like DNA-binding domain-containing protein n=1 Tax=Sesamum angolense TaxID=2727404 RepID=A0AAE2BJ66_9LAMI|nr:hypothetical protein Sango_2344400 [Sesamum angolense]
MDVPAADPDRRSNVKKGRKRKTPTPEKEPDVISPTRVTSTSRSNIVTSPTRVTRSSTMTSPTRVTRSSTMTSPTRVTRVNAMKKSEKPKKVNFVPPRLTRSTANPIVEDKDKAIKKGKAKIIENPRKKLEVRKNLLIHTKGKSVATEATQATTKEGIDAMILTQSSINNSLLRPLWRPTGSNTSNSTRFSMFKGTQTFDKIATTSEEEETPVVDRIGILAHFVDEMLTGWFSFAFHLSYDFIILELRDYGRKSVLEEYDARQGSSVVHHENFPLKMGTTRDCDHTVSVAEYNKLDRGKTVSDEDEPSFVEGVADGRNDPSKGKKASMWQRVKWTDTMEEIYKFTEKGKWKSVSKVMAERGHFVSPQQCEDKFNDLNKRYKRLNEILGRGTSCEVVENPALLDMMDHISDKAKEEVRKILSSKHLHYEEMCSYHNGNRLHLPPDPELQRSLRLALRSRDDHDDNDLKRHPHDDDDEVDQEAEFDDHGESEDNQALPGDHRAYGLPGNPAKRVKHCQGHEDFSFRNSLNSVDCNKTFNFQAEHADSDANQVTADGPKTNTMLPKQWFNHRNLQLEEQRLHIELQMLELEKERFKWQRFCRKKDRELEMMKMEIENETRE